MTKLNQEVLEELRGIGDSVLEDLNKNAEAHTKTISDSENTLQAIKGAVEGVKAFFAKMVQVAQGDPEDDRGQEGSKDSEIAQIKSSKKAGKK